MLRRQLQNRGFATTKEIAEEICSEYNHFPLEEYEKRRVDEIPGKVLTERGVVRPARNEYEIVGEYDPTKMSDSELKELIDVCARGSKGWQVKANGSGLSRCPRLINMWYRGLARPSVGTDAMEACNGASAQFERIPGGFPGRGELRGIPV
jgi:hypothetical protein